MAKIRTAAKHFQLTDADKENFGRFGCTLKAKSGVFLIDWRGRSLEAASKSAIFARLGFIQTNSVGSIVLLAIEISPVRPLPYYCYLPFDSGNEVHQSFLAHLAKDGEIRLCFCDGRRSLERTHNLGPYLTSQAAGLYARARESFESSENNIYNFASALEELERWVPVPELLSHYLSEQNLPEFQARIRHAAQTIPNQRTERVQRILRKAIEVLKPEYERGKAAPFRQAELIRRGITLIGDLHRLSVDGLLDPTRFLVEGIATTFSDDEIENLERWVRAIASLPTILSELQAKPEVVSSLRLQVLPMLPAGIADIFELVAVKGGISPKSLETLAGLMGLRVEGSPGRPTKDYSREYELKLKLSWAEVARVAVVERSDLRKEFGGLDYDSLDPVKRQQVSNRIRQGVYTYAERSGKPMPSEIESDEEQKTS